VGKNPHPTPYPSGIGRVTSYPWVQYYKHIIHTRVLTVTNPWFFPTRPTLRFSPRVTNPCFFFKKSSLPPSTSTAGCWAGPKMNIWLKIKIHFNFSGTHRVTHGWIKIPAPYSTWAAGKNSYRPRTDGWKMRPMPGPIGVGTRRLPGTQPRIAIPTLWLLL
jgi:hypothetical protein